MKYTLTDWLFLPLTLVIMFVSYIGCLIYFHAKYAFIAGRNLAKET